jgi:hypothetical protein
MLPGSGFRNAIELPLDNNSQQTVSKAHPSPSDKAGIELRD